ncbi:MAG: 23S rRNA (guanosine(2251)-2'-O)-methyltransferase RlmB [Acidobacteria bacterium]|nr:23S rRNA (guanosine(2251)-2'-O)-methyltransferase RlmB [Acidobacteriota bacterium]MCI0620735.1 23S rRNA (guanosine(2251)-2'-O)-methyltransferase RlmB [Acidobacteriota bacterium]MCI0719706.1 23S rRNA (guanosine(2251)-2'-O)-methyltransferase RlmB [Acidobacteriota bacterium]
MDILFGIHPVFECLKAKARPIERLVLAQGASSRSLQEIIDLARRSGVPIRFEPKAALDRQTAGGTHQGVLAVCPARATLDLDDLMVGLSASPLLVALDSIEDPRNLGAILRTCAAAGVEGVLLPKDHSAGLSETVAKTAAGALDHLKIAKVTNLVSALKTLKEKGIWIVGVETGQAKQYHELECTMPLAFIVGNEDSGLRRLVRQTCDFLVSIPTPGPIHSLNVSVAAGIVLFEALRQRGVWRQR